MDFHYDYGNIPHYTYILFKYIYHRIESESIIESDYEFIGKVTENPGSVYKNIHIVIHGTASNKLYEDLFVVKNFSFVDNENLPMLRILDINELNGYHILKDDEGVFMSGYYWLSDAFKRDFFLF